MPLSDQTLTRAEELIARYPQPRSALLPILFLLQAEDGYVSPAGVAQAAGLLGLTKAEVGAVATFYTMFRRRPVGKYLVSVCKTLPCELRGSRDISEAMARRLEVPLGGTDSGGMVTVEEVECLAACDGAPVVQVNTENYERLSISEALGLLEALLRDEVPPPTFAADGSVTEPSTAALHWRLAGLGDPPADLGGGRLGRALQALAEAHTLVEQHDERWWEAEIHRLRGVLLQRQTIPQPEEAEVWLQRALGVARRQEAKSLELRATTSLARLWQQQGKRQEAHDLLAPVYHWFTEGFDTADLQEAKALLEELA